MTVLAVISAAALLVSASIALVAARLDADRTTAGYAMGIGACGVVTLVVSSVGGAAIPPGAEPWAFDPVPRLVHGVLAVLLLAVLLRALWDRPSGPVVRCLVGVVLVVLGHAASAAGIVLPGVAPTLLVAGLYLVGAALVLGGAAVLIGRSVTKLEEAHDTRDDELRLAALDRTRVAARDHEVRTGLAGLAGAARMLSAEHSDRDLLDTLVASELRRLDALLRSTDGVSSESVPVAYDVEPVLSGLAALRRAAEMDVRLDVDPAARALGSPETLAQVLTNLITNAERHAPGSPVWITALTRGDRVVVAVRDAGPGIAAGREDVVFEAGARDRRRGGRGLGLHLCRRLMAEEHGSITIRPADPASPGCVVVLELPLPPALSTSYRPEVGAGDVSGVASCSP